MADFSISETQLSAPQGAGSAAVQAVQTPAPVTEGFMQTVSSAVDMFSKGLVASRKQEAERTQQTVVNGYIKEVATLNDALASGQMSPAQAKMRSRSVFNKYAAGYGEYIQEFEKAAKAFSGQTELGEAEDVIATEKKRREQRITQAQADGIPFLSGMTVQAQDAALEAHAASIRSNQALAATYKRQESERAAGTYDATVAAREAQVQGVTLINDIAGTNLNAFSEYGRTLSAQVASGKLTQKDAEATFTQRFAQIDAAIQSAAGVNGALAGPYKELFKSMYDNGIKSLSPDSDIKAVEDQFKLITGKMKLVAMQDPKTAALVVTNQLIPNNVALQSSVEAVRTLSLLSSLPVDSPGYVPQVVGNPDAEPDALKMLKSGLTELSQGKPVNKELATTQASNSLNQILKQTGQALDRGADPQSLKGLAAFFASTEYGSFSKSGKLDNVSAGAAKKTFQMLYEPTVIKAVTERLNQNLEAGTTSRLPTSKKTGVDVPTKVGDVVNVIFSGSGITFESKTKSGLNYSEAQSQKSTLESLRAAQIGVNQLIHIGAHMEGSTDYGKHWEENKHIYMPSVFPDPARLKPGAIKDGYKYLGGAYNDRNSWEAVGGK